MEPTTIKKVTAQIHQRYPEFAGSQPKVKVQPRQPDQAGGSDPLYLFTFSSAATVITASGKKSLPRRLRVVVDAKGKIIKVSTSH